jgi:cytochrome P460
VAFEPVVDRLRHRTNSPLTTTLSIKGDNVFLDSPPPDPPRKRKDDHSSSFGVIWVNEIARPNVGSGQAYPVGSIIVREKLKRENDVVPELLAVMIKRPVGFSKDTNDWEYLTVNGKLNKIRQRQTTGLCHDCHSQHKETDFVFPINK